jgi:CRISPR/Cas system CSM-associated protein Csm5 (group 7 of RAMP superfamily)
MQNAIPTLNIRTNTDFVVPDTSAIPNALNVVIPNKDHNEIASVKNRLLSCLNSLMMEKFQQRLIPENEACCNFRQAGQFYRK